MHPMFLLLPAAVCGIVIAAVGTGVYQDVRDGMPWHGRHGLAGIATTLAAAGGLVVCLAGVVL